MQAASRAETPSRPPTFLWSLPTLDDIVAVPLPSAADMFPAAAGQPDKPLRCSSFKMWRYQSSSFTLSAATTSSRNENQPVRPTGEEWACQWQKGPGAPPPSPPPLRGRAERSVGQLRLATWVVSLKTTLFVQFEILLAPPVLLLQDVHFLPTSGTQWPAALSLHRDHRCLSESLAPESHTATFNPN